jgi:GNAT superfamily N-acetyltransferase
MDPQIRLSEVPIERLLTYRAAAAREHVSVSNTQNTRWFGAFVPFGNEPVGFGAVYWVGLKARIKGIYVVPGMRGRGIGSQMTERLIQFAVRQGATQLEAFALNPAWYEARGWTKTDQQLRSGAWRVVKSR